MARSAEELDLDALKLAFLQYMLGRVGGADKVATAREKALFDTICPPESLRRSGLADAAGQPTALADPARIRALMVLPGALSEAERLRLITPLAELAAVDGSVDLREQSYVASAGQLLALSLSTIAEHLAGTGVNVVVR
jgi:uncharacterized tellurite resistance protein B-like protein